MPKLLNCMSRPRPNYPTAMVPVQQQCILADAKMQAQGRTATPGPPGPVQPYRPRSLDSPTH